jgi:AsmA protein
MSEEKRRRPADLGSTRPGLGRPDGPHGHGSAHRGDYPERTHPPYRGGGYEPARRGRSRTASWALNIGLGLVALVVGLGTFLVLATPQDLIRDRLIVEVRQRTGRDLRIEGGARFTLLPSPGISASRVSLSAPPEMPGEPLLIADSVDVSVALLPLVMREIRIERLIFTKPHIHLRIDGAGRRSWDFAAVSDFGDGKIRLAQAPTPRIDGKAPQSELEAFAKNASAPSTVRPNALTRSDAISLGDVRIVEGRVTWSDVRAGLRYDFDGLNTRVALPRASGPLDVTGSMQFAGERFDVVAKLASVVDAMEARPTRGQLDIKGKAFRASYEGLLTLGQTLHLDGRVSLAGPSAAVVARLAGFELQGGDQLAVALEGQLEGQPQRFSLSSAKATIGETSAQGRVVIDSTPLRPRVQTSLKLATLDLDRLTNLAIAPLPRAPSTPATAPPRDKPGNSAPPPRSIEDLIERAGQAPAAPKAGPQVRGFTRRAGEGWSVDPLEVSGLRKLDFDGRLDIDRLVWQQAEATQIQATLSLAGGVLKANVTEAHLYGGRAKALLNVDARQDAIVVGANISADGVAVLPLLTATNGIDTVDGRGRFIVAMSAQGTSERELISTLDGKAEMTVADGAVIGWSVADISSGLAKGRLPSFDRNPSARTPFTRLAATMPIAKGVGRTQDIRLDSPSVEASGAGLVNFVDRNVDITVKPKATGGTGLAGLEVPVRIAGTWGDIRAIPDLNAAMRSPQAQEAVRQIGRQLQGGDIDGALRGVLGSGPGSDEKVGKAKDAIKQLFGR